MRCYLSIDIAIKQIVKLEKILLFLERIHYDAPSHHFFLRKKLNSFWQDLFKNNRNKPMANGAGTVNAKSTTEKDNIWVIHINNKHLIQ